MLVDFILVGQFGIGAGAADRRDADRESGDAAAAATTTSASCAGAGRAAAAAGQRAAQEGLRQRPPIGGQAAACLRRFSFDQKAALARRPGTCFSVELCGFFALNGRSRQGFPTESSYLVFLELSTFMDSVFFQIK